MTNSYLLFTLCDRLFGVRLMGALEILGWRPVRMVPLSYSFVEGLLEYRGTIYPVYNLAQKLGIVKPGPIGFTVQHLEADSKTQIILLEENKVPFGIRVDSVVKMLKLDEQPAGPDKVQGIDHKFVKGIVHEEEHEVLILDFERLFHAG
jgi:purine-binding chemotaxis protein CheW